MSKNYEKLVVFIQEKWAEIIINIGKAYSENKDLGSLVNELISLYAFDYCDVLFKPTLAKNEQFRSSKDEFISYFIGENNVCKEDKGFAIKKWKSIKFQGYKISSYGDSIISMGNYFFEDQEGSSLKVEYTFGFIKINNENELKINLHHSSLPYK